MPRKPTVDDRISVLCSACVTAKPCGTEYIAGRVFVVNTGVRVEGWIPIWIVQVQPQPQPVSQPQEHGVNQVVMRRCLCVLTRQPGYCKQSATKRIRKVNTHTRHNKTDFASQVAWGCLWCLRVDVGFRTLSTASNEFSNSSINARWNVMKQGPKCAAMQTSQRIKPKTPQHDLKCV